MQTLLTQVNEIFASEQFVREPIRLYEPIEYTLRLGGKRIRPLMLLAANRMFGGSDDKVRHAAIGIEVFHNFTLLHDDLMDRSPLRRGQPTVYRKHSHTLGRHHVCPRMAILPYSASPPSTRNPAMLQPDSNRSMRRTAIRHGL